ncbi:MAG: hypothetical protein ABSH08_06630 [Tepidisphaeraceae bacterium]|jgi:L-fucose mutarotase/ribose pyranase (RbsD/FucU family)
MALDVCDLCGRKLEPHNYYVVRIDVFADPSMPAVSSAELEAVDFDAAIDELLDQMKDMTADQLQDQVHRRFEVRICPACQPEFLANPLGKPRGAQVGDN